MTKRRNTAPGFNTPDPKIVIRTINVCNPRLFISKVVHHTVNIFVQNNHIFINNGYLKILKILSILLGDFLCFDKMI